MIKKYIHTAMEHAKYEILKDDGTYYGEIKECPGVYSVQDYILLLHVGYQAL